MSPPCVLAVVITIVFHLIPGVIVRVAMGVLTVIPQYRAAKVRTRRL